MVEKGMTASEIQAELEKRVGGNLSGIPNRESSYALPIVFATGAALLLFIVFVRLRRKEEDEAEGSDTKKAAPTDVSVDDARLQDELDSEE
jgi:hypothetical protein